MKTTSMFTWRNRRLDPAQTGSLAACGLKEHCNVIFFARIIQRICWACAIFRSILVESVGPKPFSTECLICRHYYGAGNNWEILGEKIRVGRGASRQNFFSIVIIITRRWDMKWKAGGKNLSDWVPICWLVTEGSCVTNPICLVL